ncbi:MAG: STAS domain-containing protein [Vicinamibacterales bacterium]|jgi:anti-sigma B factor antagonist|nr:STAS domain-containing protein [Vicinamibacterales bacterium]
MSVTDRPVGDVVVLDVRGEMINNKEHGSVKRRVGELLGRGHLRLLLNLSQVPYMNSWGVGELASAFISVRNRNGKLKVAASQNRVTKMLAISRLDTAIEVFDTEAEALHSFEGV